MTAPPARDGRRFAPDIQAHSWHARSARAADLPAIMRLHETVFRPPVAVWAKDLFERHPAVGADRFVVVEDSDGSLAGSLVLIPQAWSLDGITIPVSQIELVATAAAFRGRGILRAEMGWVAEQQRQLEIVLGCVQGTPVVYQKLGYHFAVDLKGGIQFTPANLPIDSTQQPRRATADDLPALVRLKQKSLAFLDLQSVTSETIWSYQESQSLDSEHAYETFVLGPARDPAAYVRLLCHIRSGSLVVREVAAETEDALVDLFAFVRSAAIERGAERVIIRLPASHPALATLKKWGSTVLPPYAWQVHVLNWTRLLDLLRPVYNQRLAASGLYRPDGAVTLAVADEGTVIRLPFRSGILMDSSVELSQGDRADAVFTRRTLTALLLGYRSLPELEEQFLEVRCNRDVRDLIQDLFPRRQGYVYEVY
jgi:predicted acetyltransferase